MMMVEQLLFGVMIPRSRDRGPIEVFPLEWAAAEWLRMRLKVVFEPSDEGGYTVYIPSLPGCVSEGDTLEEARENIREAIGLYLEPTDEMTVPEGDNWGPTHPGLG